MLTSLEARPAHQLALTGEVLQSLELLAMSAAELNVRLLQIAGENPFIDVERWPDASQSAAGGSYRPSGGREGSSLRPAAELPVPVAPCLEEHLEAQIGVESMAADVRAAARVLIRHLDARGLLAEDLREIAARSGLAPQLLARAMDVMRTLDPTGIGATSPREAMLAQLRAGIREREERGVHWPQGLLALRILREQSDLLAEGRVHTLAVHLGLPIADIAQALAVLRTLHPFPAAVFEQSPPLYATPDLVVQRDLDGRLGILLEERGVASIGYRDQYAHGVLRTAKDKEERDLIRQWLVQGRWVMQALERRRSTLRLIGEALLAMQTPYFERGPRHLLPMTLDDVAAEIGMHKSTVSRALRGKYIATPHGLFACAELFSSALGSEGPNGVSSETVKRQIWELVAAEDPAVPLSDEEICRRIAAQGTHIARRTVTKYRTSLGIPSRLLRLGRRTP